MNSFGIRGVIEGFYGKPWTHVERIDMINFLEIVKPGPSIFEPWIEHRPQGWANLG
jgi:hyaluronoglucosaminidase